MNITKCITEVLNVPNNSRPYIVARYTEFDNNLWFHSAWDDVGKARETAVQVAGLVVIRQDSENG